MFVGAFVSGYLPLSVNLSSAKLRIVTIFGAGLLVGTALIVIIPEGIAMHYDSQLAEKNSHAHEHAEAAADGAEGPPKHGSHWQIGAALAFGFAFQLIVGEHHRLVSAPCSIYTCANANRCGFSLLYAQIGSAAAATHTHTRMVRTLR